jgi:tetratricopeptide (TPR) repeat protein
MNRGSNGPIINSRHNNNLPKRNNSVFIVPIVIVLLLIVSGVFFLAEKQPSILNLQENEEKYLTDEIIIEKPSIAEDVEENITKVEEEIVAKEEGSVDFFYQRALANEKAKDYEGAVKDYTRTIEKATRYSAEMWNALNNRGIINAKQFKDYKAAITDFNKIIEIETNRNDGNANVERLEAGYTNRAYVKKMKGDKEGACNDLYEALYLGVESSQKFIQQQIDKNCL